METEDTEKYFFSEYNLQQPRKVTFTFEDREKIKMQYNRIIQKNDDDINKCIEYKFNSNSKCLHITNVIPILKQIINIKYQFNYSPLNYKNNLYLTDFYEKDFMRYLEIYNSLFKPISIEYYLRENINKLLGQIKPVNKNNDFRDEKDDEKNDDFDIRVLLNSKGKYKLSPHEDYPESEPEEKPEKSEKSEKPKKSEKSKKGIFKEPRIHIEEDIDSDAEYDIIMDKMNDKKDKTTKKPKKCEPIIFYPFGDVKNINTK